MPRPSLQDAIKTGLLTPNQLGQTVAISAPAIRSWCEQGKMRFEIRPTASRKEFVIPANLAILDLKRMGHLTDDTVPEALVIAARFYIALRQARGTTVPDDEIPAECVAATPEA